MNRDYGLGISIGDGDGGSLGLPHFSTSKMGIPRGKPTTSSRNWKNLHDRSAADLADAGWVGGGGTSTFDRLAQATAMFDHSKLSHWVSWYELFVHCEYRNLSPAAEMWTAKSCVGELMPSVRHIHEAIPRSIGYRILKLTSGVDRWAQRGL